MELNDNNRDEGGFQPHQTTPASQDTAQSHSPTCSTSQQLEILLPHVFEIVLSNDVLHWHEGINLSQTSKVCYRTWNDHKHRLFGELLETLYKIAGRERSSWIVGYLKNDPHDFSRQEECELLVYYLNKSVRKLHSMFHMDQLNKPSKLARLGNINMLGLHMDVEFHHARLYPNRITFAKNIAFLAYAQMQQYRGIDFDNSKSPSAFYGGSDTRTSFEIPFVDLMNEMFPFTDEKFVDFCRKYALSREHCECMGPLLKKTSIMGPMMVYATTTPSSSNSSGAPSTSEATVHLPEGLEEIIPPRHPRPFHLFDYVDRYLQARERRNNGDDNDAHFGLFLDYDHGDDDDTIRRRFRREVLQQIRDPGHHHRQHQWEIDLAKKIVCLVTVIVLIGLLGSLLYKCVMGLMLYSSSLFAVVTFSWPPLCTLVFLLDGAQVVRGRVMFSIVGFFLWWLLMSCAVQVQFNNLPDVAT